MAPETIFPGQLEACYGVLKWMHEEADMLHIDRSKLAVGGNSAGGLLAERLAQLALDRGEVDIIFKNLHIPMLNDQTVLEAPSRLLGGNRNTFIHQVWDLRDDINDNIKANGGTLATYTYLKGEKEDDWFLR